MSDLNAENGGVDGQAEVPVDPALEEVDFETPEDDEAPEDEPVLDLSAGASLPTSDEVAADQIEVTPAIVTDAKVFIVWDALNLVLVSGPHGSAEEAQVSIDFRSAKDSRAAGYVEPRYSIESVSSVNG